MALFAALLTTAAHAATVATRQETLTGDVSLSREGIKVGSKAVAWADVLYVCTGQPVNIPRSAQAVRFANGEAWYAPINTLAEGQLALGSGLLGQRKIALDAVTSLDFGSMPVGGGTQSNTLYREAAAPVPGKLLWIDAKRLAVDSPLGILTLQRTAAGMRYVFTNEPPPAAKDDEILLTDGSILRTPITFAPDALQIQHPVLGNFTIPAAAIAGIVRHPSWAACLTDISPAVRSTPLLTQTIAPQKIDAAEGFGRLLCGLAIPATTHMEYRLPPHESATILRATIGPIPQAKGSATVRITVGDKELLRQEFSPTDPPKSLAADLPAGETLIIDVDYGTTLAFPCGILLADPVLVNK